MHPPGPHPKSGACGVSYNYSSIVKKILPWPPPSWRCSVLGLLGDGARCANHRLGLVGGLLKLLALLVGLELRVPEQAFERQVETASWGNTRTALVSIADSVGVLGASAKAW